MAKDMTDPYQTLGVKKNATAEEIKAAYHALAFKYHPDRNHSKVAADNFRNITSAWEILSDPDKRKKFDTTGSAAPLTISTKKGSYVVGSKVASGDVATVYHSGHVVLKVVKDIKNNDILQNEAKILNEVRPPKEEDTGMMRYLPKLWDTFRISDGRQVNATQWLENYYTLEEVRAAYPDGVKMEHGVWMVNRVLEALDYIHTKKNVIHGQLIPSHIMVYASPNKKDPYTHGARLVGFGGSVHAGDKIKILSPKYRHFYPDEIMAKNPVGAATDIFMAMKCLIYVLGGNPRTDTLPSSTPLYLTNFIKGCMFKNMRMRPNSAWDLYEEFKEHMNKHYGPKKYVQFDMPLKA